MHTHRWFRLSLQGYNLTFQFGIHVYALSVLQKSNYVIMPFPRTAVVLCTRAAGRTGFVAAVMPTSRDILHSLGCARPESDETEDNKMGPQAKAYVSAVALVRVLNFPYFESVLRNELTLLSQ